jgi:1-acyl-sn-glycerol-3-phosphate acyltransferase
MSSPGCPFVLEMTFLISIYAWTIGGLYFILLCLITICLTFFLKPRTIDPWLKKSLRFLFKILFIKVQSEGSEKIESNTNYLFMSNHSSLFDIPLLEAYIPTYVRAVEALRQFKWPLYGWAITIMKKTEKILKKGKSIVILPEGHRTLDGNLGQFKKLPFYLAKQAGVPVIPIGLSGLFQLKHKGSWLVRPRPVKIHFGQPVSPEKIQSLSTEELRDSIRGEIQNLIDQTP